MEPNYDFESKPARIQAWRWLNSDEQLPEPDWIRVAQDQPMLQPGGIRIWSEGTVDGDPEPHIDVYTLEGTMKAKPGDWIICGTEGELYPCKDSVFQRKYGPVKDRPTVAQLEELLASEDDRPVTILPDGSIKASE